MLKKCLVRATIKIDVVTEVMAETQEDARHAADILCNELTPLYQNDGNHNFDRPTMISTEDASVWFENLDQCEFFLNAKVEKPNEYL